MKWIAINTVGALVWLLGVLYVKGPLAPQAAPLAVGDHQLAVGLAFGFVGLTILLWTNLRSTT